MSEQPKKDELVIQNGMAHIDRYDDPAKLFPLIIGGTIVKADVNQIVVIKDGRAFEIAPDYFGREILRICEAIGL